MHVCFRMLSFLAKRGIEMADRLLPGYQISPFTMDLTCSRDGMAMPLQILSDMEIRIGVYIPDRTRSGRLVVDKAHSTFGAAGAHLNTKDVKIAISDEDVDEREWDLIPHGNAEQEGGLFRYM